MIMVIWLMAAFFVWIRLTGLANKHVFDSNNCCQTILDEYLTYVFNQKQTNRIQAKIIAWKVFSSEPWNYENFPFIWWIHSSLPRDFLVTKQLKVDWKFNFLRWELSLLERNIYVLGTMWSGLLEWSNHLPVIWLPIPKRKLSGD